MRTLGLFAVAAWIALGSAARAQDVGGTSNTATLHFSKGYASGLTTGGSQLFGFSDSACGRWKWAVSLNVFSRNEKSVSRPSGVRLFILADSIGAHSTFQPGIGVTTSQSRCQTKAAFTPEPGHTYDVKETHQTCTLAVTDTATGAAPDKLEFFDIEDCKQQPKG